MDCQSLSKRINNLVCKGIRTVDDRKECLKLDEALRAFAKTASEEDIIEFRRCCYGLEAFSMIAARLVYEEEK